MDATAQGGFRFFTPDEARAALPALRPLLAQLREAFHDYRFAKAQHDEMLEMHGAEALERRDHPERNEFLRWRDETTRLHARVQQLVEKANDLGADVKDPLLGLVDFYARRPDGQVVLLCYRDDEPTLAWWHPVDTGFAGRRPLDEL